MGGTRRHWCACTQLIVRCLLPCVVFLLSACGQSGPPPTPTTALEGYTSAAATAEARNDTRSLAIIYYERANEQFAQGNYGSAIADYNEVTRLDPNNARAYNNRGLAHAALGQNDEALADYNAAVVRDATYLRAYKNRLPLLEQRGALREIAADYAMLAQLEPQNAGLYRYRQGSALRGLGDNAGAWNAFTAALAADPQQVDALYERGLLNAAAGNAPDALRDFDRALELSPRAANALYARGLVQSAQGASDAAIADFSAALALQPDDAPTLLARAAAYLARNERDAARADLARAQTLPLDEALHATVATLALQLQ